MKLIVATCQFPIAADIQKNFKYISKQIKTANSRGAQVAHFPEGALSGYANAEIQTFKGFNWSRLKECTQNILELAQKYKMWVILGSAHPLTGKHKPHNSLYIINNKGQLIDRYDKMFCAGAPSDKKGELGFYSPGNHFCVFEINGVKCGTLICHEYRYPELYRQYKKKGVELMFHSYNAGHMKPQRLKALKKDVGEKFLKINPGTTIPGITMPTTMHGAAANNYMWISCSNTSARESCWASFFLRPDGVMTGRSKLNTAGVLISEVDTKKKYYDSTVIWRKNAMNGIYHSGKIVKDKRSDERSTL
ncbi:carbon-nitrogen hydrolase family protein [Candidatus Riflebacteria bacterium]